MKCPFCGNTNIARIMYGLPAFSDNLVQELKEGKKVLGGCCISGIDPVYQCNECNNKFGSPAHVIDSNGKHLNIIGNISSIEFNIGGYFYGNDCVFFDVNEFDIFVNVNHTGRPLIKTKSFVLLSAAELLFTNSENLLKSTCTILLQINGMNSDVGLKT